MSRVLSKIVQGAEEIFLLQVCHLSYMEAHVILQYWVKFTMSISDPCRFFRGSLINSCILIIKACPRGLVNIFRLSHVGNLWKDKHILVGTGVHWSIGIVMTCLSLVRLEPGVKLHWINCFIGSIAMLELSLAAK